MKTIAAQDLSSFISHCGMADLAWLSTIKTADGLVLPTLRLPVDRLRYSTARAYPVAFEARVADQPLLFVEISSFDVAQHAESNAGWAIPAAYEPSDEHARLMQLLGFDEGWEDAEHESMFVCDASFRPFWRDVADRGAFGLTSIGAPSLYRAELTPQALEAIASFLAVL